MCVYLQHLSAEELKLVMHFLKKRLAKVCICVSVLEVYACTCITTTLLYLKASEGSTQTFNLEVVGQVSSVCSFISGNLRDDSFIQYFIDEDLKYVEV